MEVKDIIVWKKTNPMPRNIERRYVQDMEFAIWAVKKGSKWTFNKDKNKPYMRSLFETPTVAGAEKVPHPTQKSLKLMQASCLCGIGTWNALKLKLKALMTSPILILRLYLIKYHLI